MFSRNRSSVSHAYALFDIGAASVGAGLVVQGPQGPELVWHTRLEYAYQGATDYTRYERAMYATLLEAGMSLTSDGIQIAKKHPLFNTRAISIVSIFAPPWFLGAVGHAVEKKQKPFTATQGLLDKLRSGMVSEFLGSSECQSWRELMGTPELVEQHETAIHLNGYQVEDYKAGPAQEIAIYSYFALVSEQVRAQVEDILHRVLPNHDLRITTSTRVLTNHLLHSNHVGVRNAVLLELGGQVTSMTRIRQGSVVSTATIPYGTHHVLYAAAPNAASTAEAKSALELALKKLPSDEKKATVPEAIVAPLREWREALTQTLRTLSGGVTIPRTVFLVGDATWYPLYGSVLTGEVTLDATDAPHIQVFPVTVPNTTQGKTASVSDTRLQSLVKAVDDLQAPK